MRRIRISAGGVLLLAALYFVLNTREFTALILAAAVHELGHVCAIRLTGGKVLSVTANLTGAVIERTGTASRPSEAICAAAGPAAGLIWAAAASELGNLFSSDTLLLSAGMSFVLSAFNLLPVLPLDGGRLLECAAGGRFAASISLVSASAVLLLGVIAAAAGMGLAPFAAGAALMAQQLRV